MKKWAGRLVKIAFFFFAFVAIMATVLVNMGGNSDTLKGAIEDYLAQTSGYTAKVETLNRMSFFPSIGFDFSNLEMTKGDDENPKITAGHVQIAIGFWDMVLSRRKIRKLDIQNVSIAPDVWGPNAITIAHIALDEDASGKTFLDVKGAIGPAPLTAKIDMQSEGDGSGRTYGFGDESAFTGALGPLSASGTLRPRSLGGFHIRDFILTMPQQALTGTLSFIRNHDGAFDLDGDFLAPEYGSQGKIDLSIQNGDQTIITGDVDAQSFDLRDFQHGSRIMNVIDIWQNIVKGGKDPAPPQIDITLKSQNFEGGGAFDGRLNLKDGVLIATPKTE
ncbi:MAG: hypothetical protein ACPGRX_09640 [Bdellovibrionales bacterium]